MRRDCELVLFRTGVEGVAKNVEIPLLGKFFPAWVHVHAATPAGELSTITIKHRTGKTTEMDDTKVCINYYYYYFGYSE